MDYADLSAPDGTQNNMGGTTSRILFAPLTDFDAIEKPIAVPVTLADLVSIVDPHTFVVTKGFLQAYATEDSGKLETKIQGERDGKSFRQEGEFFFPGSEAEAHGLAAQAKNDKFILMVESPDSETKGYLQVGTEMFPASIDPEFSTGTNASGRRGYIFKYSAMTDKQYVYTAAITLKP